MAKRGADEFGAGKETSTSGAFSRATAPGAGGASSSADVPLGSWASDTGKCRVAKDPITSRVAYEEHLPEGRRLHGWLNAVEGEERLWRGTLALLEAGRPPWYGPSFGPEPEMVGSIQVRSLPGAGEEGAPAVETQIRVEGEDEDWQAPVRFRKDTNGESGAPAAPKIEWTDGKVAKPEEEEEKEWGDKKRTKTA